MKKYHQRRVLIQAPPPAPVGPDPMTGLYGSNFEYVNESVKILKHSITPNADGVTSQFKLHLSCPGMRLINIGGTMPNSVIETISAQRVLQIAMDGYQQAKARGFR